MHTGRIEGNGPTKMPSALSRRGWVLLLLIIPALWPVLENSANAASFTLLRIQNLSQGVGGSYHFRDNSAGSGNEQISSSKHEFIENYNLSGDFSLLNPHLIKGAAGLDLFLDQRKEADQTRQEPWSSAFNLGYRVSSILLDRSPFPISINADSSLRTESPPFTRSYDVESDNLVIGVNITNKYLPARLSLMKNSSETSGLTDDRRQTTETFTMSANHAVSTLSSTSFTFTREFSESTLLASGAGTNSSKVGVGLANGLSWQNHRGLSRSLYSSYAYSASSGFFKSTQHALTSNLNWWLGKSLNSSAGYSYSNNKSETQRFQLQAGNLSLSHHLFESLTTSISGMGSSARFSDGSENAYGGGLNLSYRKKLPAESLFMSSYSFSYSVSDRQRSNATVAVENERHPIPLVDPKRIALANPTFLASTITVRGAQTLILYTRDVDYTVIPEGIEVLPGHMVGDTEVLVSYTFLQDPRVTFASASHAASASLNLHNREHFIYANYRASDKQLLAGRATEVTLSPSSHLDVGYERHIDRHTFHAEYGWNKSATTKTNYLDARWLHQRPFAAGNLSLSAAEHFSWYDQGAAANAGNWNNTFGINGAYTRNLTDAVAGRLGVGYLNFIGESAPVRNLFSANLNLDGHFGKTTITLSSSLTLGVSSSSTSRSEAVGISFHRYF